MAVNLTAVTKDGRMIDYSNAFTNAEWSTQRFDAPGKLTFSGVEDTGIALPEGTAVTFTDDGSTFKGYIFTAERDRYGNVSYTAYDQLRYLKANASYSWEAVTLEQIITDIASDFQIGRAHV